MNLGAVSDRWHPTGVSSPPPKALIWKTTVPGHLGLLYRGITLFSCKDMQLCKSVHVGKIQHISQGNRYTKPALNPQMRAGWHAPGENVLVRGVNSAGAIDSFILRDPRAIVQSFRCFDCGPPLWHVWATPVKKCLLCLLPVACLKTFFLTFPFYFPHFPTYHFFSTSFSFVLRQQTETN